jgi:hypothetical protein
VTRSTGRPNGRPPKPTELKLLEGNPGKRPLGDKAAGDIPATIPPYPPALREPGRRAWDQYWTHGRTWLAASDIQTLTQLCRLHDEESRLRRIIMREGLTHVVEATRRSSIHHLYNDLTGIRRQMRELWSLCYMTPTDRGRAQVKVPDVDPLDAWAAGE